MRRDGARGRLGTVAPLLGIAGVLLLLRCGRQPHGPSPAPVSAPPIALRNAAASLPASGEGGPELARGADFRRALGVGETHVYRVRLQPGSYLRVVVSQRGTDARLVLRSPRGDRLLAVDSPNGTEGPEELSAVASAAGEHRVEVAGAVAAPGGSYELTVEELRPATGEDRSRAAAVRAFAEAEQLRSAHGAEPLRAAIARYEDALGRWQRLGATGRAAMALRRLGQAWFALGEVRRAQGAYQQALSSARGLHDRVEEAWLLNELGNTFRLLDEPGKAAACYEDALRRAREIHDRAAEVTALNNLGVAYYALDETQKALTFYGRALAGWRQLADSAREADTLHNLGEIYTQWGRFDEAFDVLDQALALKARAADRRGQAASLSALGWVHYLAGDLRAALSDYDRSLRLRRETGDRRGEAATLDRRGTVLAKLGRKAEALAAYRDALAVFQRSGERASEAYVLASIGGLDESCGRAELALQRFARSLRLFQQIRDRSGEAYAHLGNARAARRLGRLAWAQSEIEAALSLVESLQRGVQSRAFRTSYLASRQEYYELYVQILMDRHRREPRQEWAARALEASNRARARSLLEAVAEAQVDHLAETAPHLLAAERSLAARIRSRELRRIELLGRGSAAAGVAALERELSALLLEYENLQGEIRKATPALAAVRQTPPLALRDVQQLLDENTALLWYALGSEQSYLWVVEPHALATYSLPGGAQIEAAARQVHELLAKSHEKGVREQAQLAAAALSEMILGPAAGRLGNKRLVIAGDGALQYVPFAALPAAGGGRTPLLVEHEIVSIPSAAVLALVRRGLARRRPAPKALAVLADPVFRRDDPRVLRREGAGAPPLRAAGAGTPEPAAAELERAAREAGLDGFDRLVYSAAEAEAILSLVPASERLQALSFRASRATVLSGALSRYRILHFATHGLLNSRHPELSGVVLSLVDEQGRPQDGFLRVQDLIHLSFPADLVVLSACRTALGKEIRGEGLVGLTHGFLISGVGRLVVSLWNVNDLATAGLMERFYRHLLRDGMRPAAALRAAQLSMLREKRWQAPYYWAGFTLEGEWR